MLDLLGFAAPIIGAAGIIGAVFAFAFRWHVRRSKQLSALAGRMGFFYERDGPAWMLEGFAGFELFGQGSSRRFHHVLKGRMAAGQILLFDYEYTVGSGKNSSTYYQTVFALETPGRELPAFSLAPETFSDKLFSLFGSQDIDFEEFPAFSKAYLLRGKDESAVRALFAPRALREFESRPGFFVEGAGGWLMFYKSDAAVSVDKLETFFSEGAAVCASLSH